MPGVFILFAGCLPGVVCTKYILATARDALFRYTFKNSSVTRIPVGSIKSNHGFSSGIRFYPWVPVKCSPEIRFFAGGCTLIFGRVKLTLFCKTAGPVNNDEFLSVFVHLFKVCCAPLG